MAPCKVHRKLTTIFSTDVQGYSRLMGDDEAATVRTLTAYREIISTHIEKNGGRVIDSPGDNLLAEFGSVVLAVECAVEIQKELKEKTRRCLKIERCASESASILAMSSSRERGSTATG